MPIFSALAALPQLYLVYVLRCVCDMVVDIAVAFAPSTAHHAGGGERADMRHGYSTRMNTAGDALDMTLPTCAEPQRFYRTFAA